METLKKNLLTLKFLLVKTALPQEDENVKIAETLRVVKEAKTEIRTHETPEYNYAVNRAQSRKNLLILSVVYFMVIALIWYFIKGR